MSTRVETPEQAVPAQPAREHRRASSAFGWLTAVGRFARRKPLGALGGVIVVALLVMAAFAEVIAPYGYDETIRGARMRPPSAAHWLGTDNLPRDTWRRHDSDARIPIHGGLDPLDL